jgi:hypothetical protein
VNTFWDIGKDDNTAIWFHQSHGGMHHLIDYYENNGEGVAFYARILREKKDLRGWEYGKRYGPHDLDHRHWLLPGSDRIQDVARNLGINSIVVPRIHNKADAIEPARNFLSTTWIDEEHCIQGIRCLDSYAKAWDETHGTYKSEPVHNWASHGADALQTGARGFIPDYIPPPNDRYYRRPKAASAWAA